MSRYNHIETIIRFFNDKDEKTVYYNNKNNNSNKSKRQKKSIPSKTPMDHKIHCFLIR